MDTLHPNIAALPSGSKRSSTPSIRNCLEKPLHLVADSSAANCVHSTMSIERDGCLSLSLLPSASNDFSALLAEYFSIIY